MPVDGLKVVRSKIHGYGVIATRPFRKGEVVTFGDGVMYHEDDEFDDTYSLVYSDEQDEQDEPYRYYDLVDHTRWINHACAPNCEVSTGLDPQTKEPTAWWTALRDLEVGEELTYDYCFSGHLAEPCFCKADACIGLIVDPDELSEVPEKLQHLILHDKLMARASQPQLRDL